MKKIVYILSFFLTLLLAEQGSIPIKSIDGKTLHTTLTPNGALIEEVKGKIVFLELYGHRCPYCIEVIATYNRLQAKYKEKLAIVAIELGGLSESELQAFDTQHNIEYTNITLQQAGALVPHISQKGGYIGMVPFLVVLDTNGNIIFTRSGPITEAELEELIAKHSK